jgi:hypothetical protein
VAAEEVAQELGIGHAKAGMMACGTPRGTPAFITPFLAEHTARTCSLTDALLGLPLATQDRFLVLRSSLVTLYRCVNVRAYLTPCAISDSF